MFDELNPDTLDANTRDRLNQPVSLAPADQGVFHNFWKGTANYTMRGLAEAGRAIDMAGAAWPVVMDKITGGTSEQDKYFQTHDEIFNNAVDYWTPSPGDVGKAGEVAGGLIGGLAQLTISPALMIGTAQLGGSEDLVRQGVDATTANVVGGVQGASTAVGIKLPYLGKTLASRVTSGVGGNVLQGFAARGLSSEALKLRGYDLQATQFDPWDIKSIALDALMGAAFGGLAHLESRGADNLPKTITPAEQDALLTLNQARHLDNETVPGMPVSETDLNQHVSAMRQAVDQTLRGEPVNVDAETLAMRMAPDPVLEASREGVGREIAKAVMDNYLFVQQRTMDKFNKQMEEYHRGGDTYAGAEQRAMDKYRAQIEAMTKPIEVAKPTESSIPLLPPTETKSSGAGVAEKPELPSTDPAILKARQAVADNPELRVAAGEDADGNPLIKPATEVLQAADDEAAQVQKTAPGLFQTVAHCLLGIL